MPVIEDARTGPTAPATPELRVDPRDRRLLQFHPTEPRRLRATGPRHHERRGQLAARLRLLRDHGRVGQYEHAIVGQTARLDNLQAAVLRVQADCLEQWNERRRQVAAWYRELLPAGIVCPDADGSDQSVYHLFVVRVQRRDGFRAHLEAHGILSAVHYPVPLPLQAAYRHLGHGPGDFPVAERLAGEIVSLPIHPFIERAQVQYIADVGARFLQSAGTAAPSTLRTSP